MMLLKQSFGIVVCIVFLYLCIVFCAIYLQRCYKHQNNTFHDRVFVPVACFLGFKAIAADWLWFTLLVQQDYLDTDNFMQLAEYIIQLDPHFSVIYRYAYIYLKQYRKSNEHAVMLLKKSFQSSIALQDERMQRYIRYECI